MSLRSRLRAILLVSLWLLGAGATKAQPSIIGVEQLRHVEWSIDDGAPATVLDMAQDRSGFLWLSSQDGLVRFDGTTFEIVDRNLNRERFGFAQKLMTGHDGSLWAWYPKAGLAVWRNGRINFVPSPDVYGEVINLHQTWDGAVWLGIGQIGKPFWRYHQREWTSVDVNPRREELLDALVAQDGSVWLSYKGSLFRKSLTEAVFVELEAPSVNLPRLATDRQGAVWALGSDGGQKRSGPGGRVGSEPTVTLRWQTDQRAWSNPMFDKTGNLWLQGLGRFARIAGIKPEPRTGDQLTVEQSQDLGRFLHVRPTTVFVDRDGNAWIATRKGIHRFSMPIVISEPRLQNIAYYGDILLRSSTGEVYIGQRDAIYSVAPNGSPVSRLQTMAEPEAMCEGPDGTIWVVLEDRIVGIRGRAQTEMERPTAEASIYECAFDQSGRFWLTASGSGLFWRDGSSWRKAEPLTDTDAFRPTQKWVDERARLWVFSDPDRLTMVGVDIGSPTTLDLGALGRVRSLHPTTLGLLVSGRDGATLIGRTGRATLVGERAQSLRNASGLVQTAEGDTWLFRPSGMFRVRTADLQKAFDDPNFAFPERRFGFESGLPDAPHAQTWRSMVIGGDGRIWLATLSGIAWLDPTSLQPNPDPPQVQVTSLTVGDTTVTDPGQLQFDRGTTDVAIGFSAISLSMPERVSVLYRLEGHDDDWVDSGSRREAFYTNLGPGDYRFRVIAANEDGVWNRVGDDLEFSIPPTFIQSTSFKILIFLALAGLGWAIYRFRVNQLAAAAEARFQVRTAERERIARELHDTLLQGLQGLMLRFQAVSNRLSSSDPIRSEIDTSLDRAEAVLAEGRSRVRDLRNDAASGDLATALIDALGDLDTLNENTRPGVDVLIEGPPRGTTPLVNEEILRIADEAVRNALLHADADQVIVTLRFGQRSLELSVCDDGRGLPADVQQAGERAGHFGLRGMRERAERIGGRMIVATRSGGGTDLRVSVPARSSYADSRTVRGWLSSSFPAGVN